MNLVSIVLPIHNQADHVGRTVEEYAAGLARVPTPHEILLVVNGCRDHMAFMVGVGVPIYLGTLVAILRYLPS